MLWKFSLHSYTVLFPSDNWKSPTMSLLLTPYQHEQHDFLHLFLSFCLSFLMCVVLWKYANHSLTLFFGVLHAIYNTTETTDKVFFLFCFYYLWFEFIFRFFMVTESGWNRCIDWKKLQPVACTQYTFDARVKLLHSV